MKWRGTLFEAEGVCLLSGEGVVGVAAYAHYI